MSTRADSDTGSQEPAVPASDPVTKKNIEAIARLEKRAMLNHSTGERIAADVTRWAGSVLLIAIHIVWFTLWVVANIGWLPDIEPWDPYPFNFLTLVVSLEAIFLSLLVLMAQNRLTRDSDKRAQLDLQINMLAEQESTATLRMLEKICQHLGIDFEVDEEKYLAKKTDVNRLAKTLDEKLPQ